MFLFSKKDCSLERKTERGKEEDETEANLGKPVKKRK
jgi:hypothetical protein